MAMTTQTIMLWVLAALFPGFVALSFMWGFGIAWNVIWLCILCAGCELGATYLRRLPKAQTPWSTLTDGATLVTAVLIALCLPPFMHPGILAVAAIASIGLAKHIYGGLGRNVFNPAMVGYAVILVSFPQSLAHWPDALANDLDGFSGATTLTHFRYRAGTTTLEFEALHGASMAQDRLVACCFLVGGVVLLYKRLLAWRTTAGMLAGLALGTLFGYDQGSSQSLGGAWFHATTGGFMLAAFFVVTDPVTHPRGPRHQLIFGLIIGLLVYLIRAYGSFPDGIAFAVLFANCLTPFMNRLPPRHRQPLRPETEQENAANG